MFLSRIESQHFGAVHISTKNLAILVMAFLSLSIISCSQKTILVDAPSQEIPTPAPLAESQEKPKEGSPLTGAAVSLPATKGKTEKKHQATGAFSSFANLERYKFIDSYKEICSKIDFPLERNRCYTEVARITKNPEVCKDIDDSIFRGSEFCYSAIAYVTEDGSYCDAFQAFDQKKVCKEAVAVARGDVELCDALDTVPMRESCYYLLLWKNKDPAICNKIKTDTGYEGCIMESAQVTGDVSRCELLEKEDYPARSTCISGLVDRDYYHSGCLNVGENINREVCFDILEDVLKDFMPFRETSACNSIKNEEFKASCIRSFVRVSGDISLCSQIEANTSDWFQCIKAAAVANNDKGACERIKNEKHRELCLMDVSIFSNDVELCRSLGSTARKDECIKYLAIANNDASLCKETNSKEDRVWCIKHVARATQNPTICEEIDPGNNAARGSCYTGLFLSRDDWHYDCGWVNDWSHLKACMFAKAQGMQKGGFSG